VEKFLTLLDDCLAVGIAVDDQDRRQVGYLGDLGVRHTAIHDADSRHADIVSRGVSCHIATQGEPKQTDTS
jgi:hypothetical protein